MGHSKGTASGHQVFRQIGGHQKTLLEGTLDPLGVDLKAGNHQRNHLQSSANVVNGAKEVLLILLKVAMVGSGKPLEQNSHGRSVAQYGGRFAACQFQHIQILLLGHHAAARTERIGQLNPMNSRTGKIDKVLGKAAQMNHQLAGDLQQFQKEVPISHHVVAVGEAG